jgi:uncharacterized delta-60 repeat protein
VLDTSFGTNGYVIGNFGGTDEKAQVLRVLSDNSFIVLGETNQGGNQKFVVAKYTRTGTLDTTFGTGGYTYVFFPGGVNYANGMYIQNDNKILVIGSAFIGSTDILIARLNANGSLDTSFGTGGKAVIDNAGAGDEGYDVLQLSTGKILICGNSDSAGSDDFMTARLLSDGTLDTTYGTAGFAINTINGVFTDRITSCKEINNSIYAAGTINVGSVSLLAKFNSTGTFDTTFGTAGKVNFGGTMVNLVRFAQDSSGNFISAKNHFSFPNYNMQSCILTSSGVVDTTWSYGGISGCTTLSFGSVSMDSYGYDIFLQPDRKIILAGAGNPNTQMSFGFARLLSNGNPDTSFGTNGLTTSSLSQTLGSVQDMIYSARPQSNGKILGAGFSYNGTNYKFVVTRFK